MKCILEANYDTPLVSFHIANRRGTACEPLGSEGLVCHTAELGFRGTRTLDRDQFDEKVDGLGAALGIGTRRDYLSLRGTCLVRHLDTLFDLAVSTLAEPRFAAEEHKQLLRETQHELDDMRDDDASLAHRFFIRHVHPGYPYCRTALGTEQSLAAITLDQATSLHQRLFRQQDLVLGVAGPIDDATLAELSGRIVVSSPCEPLPAPNLLPPPSRPGRHLVIVDKPDRKQCQVAIGHLGPAFGTQDHDRMQVAETAFGGLFTSRLMQEIRVKNGWSYGANCTMFRAKGPHGLQMTMAPAADVCAAAIARTLELFSELYEAGLSGAEFDFARSYLQGSAAFERATANQRLFRAIQEEVFELPRGYADEFALRLDSMNVSQVNESIRTCVHPRDLCVVVVATAETLLPALEPMGWDSVQVEAFDSY